jgi:DNA-binding NtrC family response regulator
MAKLLLVDDDETLRKNISSSMRQSGHTVEVAQDYENALRSIEKSVFDVIVCDVHPISGSISDIIQIIKKNNANTEIIVISEVLNDEDIQIIRRGAFGFLHKPFSLPELEIKVSKAVEIKRLQHEAQDLRGQRNLIHKTHDFVGESEEIQKVLGIVNKVARSSSSVILKGETGTGKELLAGAIHYNSPRSEGPYVRVNCAALPEQLLESELFGHEKGAFTGADKQRVGRFELANSGTILLDEITDMSLATQAKVLRVLQEKEFERLGSSRTIKVDVRVISATNKDLIKERDERRFRDDLYYRLNVVTIEVPPLRSRGRDILLLARFFLQKYSGELNKKIDRIHPAAIMLLSAYRWPGNIRELENAIERAVLLAEGDEITPEDLGLPFKGELAELGPQAVKMPFGGVKLEEVERQLVLQALEMENWVQKKAAKLLGISGRVLNYKIKSFGITHPRWKTNT